MLYLQRSVKCKWSVALVNVCTLEWPLGYQHDIYKNVSLSFPARLIKILNKTEKHEVSV